MFGRVEFPSIGEQPYFITIAPHTFYWFSLEAARTDRKVPAVRSGEDTIPTFDAASWKEVFANRSRSSLERLLPGYLKHSRWFRSKARVIRSARILDVIPLAPASSWIAMARLEYSEGEPETYLLPLALAEGEQASNLLRESAHAVVARIRREDGAAGVLCDAVHDRLFCLLLLEAIERRRRLKGESGELAAAPAKGLRRLPDAAGQPLEPAIVKAEQTNSSVIYGDRFILKLFRVLEEGVNPELEIGRFLTEKTSFRQVPLTAGAVEYRPNQGQSVTVGVLHQYVPNTGDAWRHTLDELSHYFETALAQDFSGKRAPVMAGHPLDLIDAELPKLPDDFIHASCADARLIGERTAQMHLALASERHDPEFAPEPFSDFHQQSLYHGMLALANRSLRQLRRQLTSLPPDAQADAREVLELETAIQRRLRGIHDRKIGAARIRLHGDFHLGQILCTGKDIVIIDFEGEPGRPLSERRIKRSPLRDVAGMLRSYHYASQAVLFGQVSGVVPHPEVLPALRSWADFWYRRVCTEFLKRYLETAGRAPFLPQSRDELKVLLDALVLEKAVYELGYELNHRQDWVRIPLLGIQGLVGEQPLRDIPGGRE
jgi:maltose alpha-D-glucosyltransferase/alpha-amylase